MCISKDIFPHSGFESAYFGPLTKADTEMKESIEKFRRGGYKFIMGHPEMLTQKSVKNAFKSKELSTKIGWLFVDEAHCLMPWGKHVNPKTKKPFRPAFLALKSLRASIPNLKVVGLTATASQASVKEIAKGLAMVDPAVISLPPDRCDVTSLFVLMVGLDCWLFFLVVCVPFLFICK